MLELALLASLQQQPPPAPPRNSYLFFVASAGFDQVALVRFGAAGLRIEHRTSVRLPSVDSTRPQAVRVAPDGRDYYVTTARGFPTGELLKLRIAGDSARMVRVGSDSARGNAEADTLQGREPLGGAPAALQITAQSDYAWATNATAGDDPDASWVSVIYLAQMVEVARIPTCVAPRGGRLTADGAHHYSVCSTTDEVIDIDAKAMRVARRLPLPGAQRCAPDGLAATVDGSHLYVACRQSNDVVEIDVTTWSVARRINVGAAPGNLEVTHDGRMLVVANVMGQSISLVDLAAGRSVAEFPAVLDIAAGTRLSPSDPYSFVALAAALAQVAGQHVPASVVVTPDDRYAFVSVASGPDGPGGVDVVDLARRKIVATMEVGPGARGMDFWKMEGRKGGN